MREVGVGVTGKTWRMVLSSIVLQCFTLCPILEQNKTLINLAGFIIWMVLGENVLLMKVADILIVDEACCHTEIESKYLLDVANFI